MKVFLSVCLALCFAGLIIYLVPSLRQEAIHLLTYNECDSPLLYRVGSVDQRFGLSSTQVAADIAQATGIWDSAEAKTLFTQSPNAQLVVNFVYDQRQALDTTINQLQSKLSQNNQSLSSEIAQYQKDVAAFQAQLDQFNQTVAQYNSEGGAPPDVYKQLRQQQQQLNQEGDALNQRARELNLSTNSYNYGVTALNNDIAQFQNELAQKPEEGVYNGKDNTITIYFADNKNELIHTLAHEFGHAMGMQHVEDAHAIMYPYTTNSLTVTASDIQQLNYVCRNQSSLLHYGVQADIWLYTRLQGLVKSVVK